MERLNPEVQAIIQAWISGEEEQAIALTAQYTPTARRCAHCGKPLSPQARGNYCSRHRNHDPVRKAMIQKAMDQKKKTIN